MLICGIDPGISGALCIIGYSNNQAIILEAISCPVLSGEMNCNEIISFLKCEGKGYVYPITHVAIERSQAMARPDKPRQGLVSTFNYGRNFGQYEGILYTLKIPFTPIYAQSWKKEFNLLKKPKDASILEARKLFPENADIFKFKKDHNKAEAILLAEFCHRKLSGQLNLRKEEKATVFSPERFKPWATIVLGEEKD